MIGIGLLLGLLVTGCGGNRHLAKEYKNPVFDGAPTWVFEPEYEGYLAEVGSAPPSPGGFQFQRTEALANARDELARKIHLELESVLKQRAEQSDSGKRRRLQKVVASLSDQTVRLNLAGSVQKDLWIARDGTMFVLVALDREQVAEALREAEIFDPGEENALWLNLDRALDARKGEPASLTSR
jgi:hypothetical protein